MGCTLGIVPHTLAAVTGLAAILHSSALAFQTLKSLGVAYLLYLAWLSWRDKSELVPAAGPVQTPSALRLIAATAQRYFPLPLKSGHQIARTRGRSAES